jgi:hypothetical protein
VLGVAALGGKISLMGSLVFLVFLAAVLLALYLKGFNRAGRRMVGYWRARGTGVELQAEVIDNVANLAPGWFSGYYLAPVVRYYLDKRSYDAVIVNPSGIRRDPGSFMTIVVTPNSPDEPYDRYQGMGIRDGAALGNLLVLVGVLVLAILALARH